MREIIIKRLIYKNKEQVKKIMQMGSIQEALGDNMSNREYLGKFFPK